MMCRNAEAMSQRELRNGEMISPVMLASSVAVGQARPGRKVFWVGLVMAGPSFFTMRLASGLACSWLGWLGQNRPGQRKKVFGLGRPLAAVITQFFFVIGYMFRTVVYPAL